MPPLLTRLNPFAKLDNGRAVWAWGMFDLANQSFQLLINTLLFSIFVQQVIVAPDTGDPGKGTSAWMLMAASSLLLVVVFSPILGALADHKAWKRELLLGSGLVCALLTSALAFLQPGQLGLAFALYVTAALACGLGENFLGAFLPEISTPKNVGYVSALGWTMSYVGALLLLGITAVFALVMGNTEPEQARPMFLFAGLWFAVGILPAFLFLREKDRPQEKDAEENAHGVGGAVVAAFTRLVQSAREAGRYRDLVRFFVAFFVYSLGTQTVIYFLGLISSELGNSLGQTILFALVVALTAGLASAVLVRVQDRVGHLRTVGFFLMVWVAASLGLALVRVLDPPVAMFWIIAGLVGVGLGGIGTSSRAVVGAFSPEAKAGEFFGVWGTTYKLSGIVGVLAFGQVQKVFGLPASLLVLAGFFAAGYVLLRRVDERAGIAAAAAEEGAEDQAPAPSEA